MVVLEDILIEYLNFQNLRTVGLTGINIRSASTKRQEWRSYSLNSWFHRGDKRVAAAEMATVLVRTSRSPNLSTQKGSWYADCPDDFTNRSQQSTTTALISNKSTRKFNSQEYWWKNKKRWLMLNILRVPWGPKKKKSIKDNVERAFPNNWWWKALTTKKLIMPIIIFFFFFSYLLRTMSHAVQPFFSCSVAVRISSISALIYINISNHLKLEQ